ncbi:MAG: RbsD or FucU transport [Armatimonadetes bacterium]|nr:RbsD or FucU transport [Anaerolineae bacterium]
MLKSQLLHPEILHVLGASGHGSGILIADGNYPFNTLANPNAQRVYLNYMPGLLTVTQVLEGLLGVIPVESAHVMLREDGIAVPIHADFRAMLPGIELQTHTRYPFYEMAQGRDVSLVIATGEQRIYANILLVIGVVVPSDDKLPAKPA